jgi:long-chain acyl-CoA synthetase
VKKIVETLSARLRTAAAIRLDRPAIIEHGRVLSYQWVLSATGGLATRLAESGVGPGSRVALILPNGASFVSAFFAVAHVGGVVVPVTPSLHESEIASILKDAQVSLVLTNKDLHRRCVSALRIATEAGEDAVIVLGERGCYCDASREGASVETWPSEAAEPHAAVLFLHSSGSTGRPKRVVRSHFNLLYDTDRLIAILRLASSDRVLGVAPFTHITGLMRCMVASMLSGATLIPLLQFERRAVGRTIQEQAITIFFGAPFMFATLAETRWPEPVDFSSLRFCISSSAPLRPETCVRFYEQYGIYVRQAYGSTETGSLSVNLSPRPEDSMESVGIPHEGITVEIFSEDRRVLLPGEVGEIGIQSPAAAREYLDSPDQTKNAFVNGYFFPGDIGRKDAAGRLYLIGRKSLFINRGGYKVNPYEIEACLDRHPKVQEVAVVGVDTPYGDQKIKAVIVPTEPCDEREIIEFCRRNVAEFKIPSIVEFRTELPKNPTGKLLRRML